MDGTRRVDFRSPELTTPSSRTVSKTKNKTRLSSTDTVISVVNRTDNKGLMVGSSPSRMEQVEEQ